MSEAEEQGDAASRCSVQRRQLRGTDYNVIPRTVSRSHFLTPPSSLNSTSYRSANNRSSNVTFRGIGLMAAHVASWQLQRVLHDRQVCHRPLFHDPLESADVSRAGLSPSDSAKGPRCAKMIGSERQVLRCSIGPCVSRTRDPVSDKLSVSLKRATCILAGDGSTDAPSALHIGTPE